MTSRLVQEGWVAPEFPGPERRAAVVLASVSVAAVVAWALWLVFAASPIGGARREVTVDVAAGAAHGEIRETQRSRFVVMRRTLPAGHRYLVTSTFPAGVDARSISIRALSPGARVRASRTKTGLPRLQVDPRRGESVRVVTVAPAGGIAPGAARGSLRAVTAPLDRERAASRATVERVSSLRSALPWIVVLGPLLAVGVPLWIWRRTRRLTFSMRVPGPGKAPGGEPPSSLDAVGVAVLAAGARDVDVADAFAGHVLDLVERRQVRMRRIEPAAGERGVVLGLAHVEEGAIADDPAVAVLRSIVDEDGDAATVTLPEAAANHKVAPATHRIRWGATVDDRARFERMVTDGNAGRVRLATEVLGTIGVLAVIEGFRSGGEGHAATAWLVAALTLPATITCIAWARDARRWRVVARARRVERAQWRAWQEALGVGDGPALDQRSLPLLVAAGGRPELVRATAAPTAVALDAVTVDTIEALRAVVTRPSA
ncbi:MAG: hypothetical protein JWM86_2387 [Thermoleophilia bacterium]|nr:hypothetical protein [Thermoleophilia bacterium]